MCVEVCALTTVETRVPKSSILLYHHSLTSSHSTRSANTTHTHTHHHECRRRRRSLQVRASCVSFIVQQLTPHLQLLPHDFLAKWKGRKSIITSCCSVAILTLALTLLGFSTQLVQVSIVLHSQS